MSWRGLLAPELIWFLSYKHLKFPNLAGFCSYALTLTVTRMHFSFEKRDSNFLKVCEMGFSVICLTRLIYLIKIKDNIGLINFMVLRKRIFRYFPFSIDNFLHYLALCGTSCFGTTMGSGGIEVVKQY